MEKKDDDSLTPHTMKNTHLTTQQNNILIFYLFFNLKYYYIIIIGCEVNVVYFFGVKVIFF